MSETTQFVIDRRNGGDVTRLELKGELDMASGPVLEQALQAAESTGRTVVIDLGGLEFLDSTGLRVLLGAQSRSVQNGHRLSLRAGPPSVQRVFELTGTDGAFRFEG